ncbi:hypothetical protein ACXIUS_05160 [Bosea thiooxidans]|nr:hypothetical protein [Bosea sp. (in: a-proteobacteria)]
MILLARPDVVRLEEQLKPVEFIDLSGVSRRHWFDFRVTFSDGCRIAVAVKHSRKAAELRLSDELQNMASQLSRSFADGVALMTERDVGRDVLHDARLIHAARRDPPNEADARVREVVVSLAGSTTVAEIVRCAGGGAEAFRAIARLVGSGDIVPNSPRLDYRTRVARGNL